MFPGFTKKYYVNKLVYFEETQNIGAAIAREKEIKKWRREKKDSLVVTGNPEWKDLSDGWYEISPCGRDDRKGEGRDDKSDESRDDKKEDSRDDRSGAGRDDNSGDVRVGRSDDARND